MHWAGAYRVTEQSDSLGGGGGRLAWAVSRPTLHGQGDSPPAEAAATSNDRYVYRDGSLEQFILPVLEGV